MWHGAWGAPPTSHGVGSSWGEIPTPHDVGSSWGKLPMVCGEELPGMPHGSDALVSMFFLYYKRFVSEGPICSAVFTK